MPLASPKAPSYDTCWQGLDETEFEFAEETCSILRSVALALPPAARSGKDPATRLAGRRGGYLVKAALGDREFPELEEFNTDRVTFIGPAAAAIRALSMDALGFWETSFARRQLKLMSATLTADVAVLRTQRTPEWMRAVLRRHNLLYDYVWQVVHNIKYQRQICPDGILICSLRFQPATFKNDFFHDF